MLTFHHKSIISQSQAPLVFRPLFPRSSCHIFWNEEEAENLGLACGLLVPDQGGIELVPSAVGTCRLNHWTNREVQEPGCERLPPFYSRSLSIFPAHSPHFLRVKQTIWSKPSWSRTISTAALAWSLSRAAVRARNGIWKAGRHLWARVGSAARIAWSFN